MQLITERLFLIPLQPDGMRALLARTTDPELIQPYTDMLDLSSPTPSSGSGTPHGALPERFRRLGSDLCFKGLPENGQPEIGYGLLPEYEHQGYATEAVRAACRWAFEQPGVTAVEAETDPAIPPRRRCCTGWGSCRPGLWARKGRGLFCAKSLDFIAKSALSPFTSPATCAIIYSNIAVCVFNGLAASANCISQICCYP